MRPIRAVTAEACVLLALVGCGATRPATVSTQPPTTTPVATADGCIVGPRQVSSRNINGGRPVLATRRDQFALVWIEAGEDHADLRLQIFDAHGQPLTGPLVIVPLTGGGGEPQITTTNDGYAIVWNIDRAETTAIMLQRVDARGHSIGPPSEAFTAPTARTLALTATPDGFVVVWWQWATQPHRQVATWLDADGKRTSEVELTRMPCDDPRADLRPQPDGRVLVAWEQAVEGNQHVIVGALSKTGIVRQGSEYVGRDPALLRDGVAMTALESSSVMYAPFGHADAVRLVPGRMIDGAVLGNDSVLCRAQHGSDEAGGVFDELFCAREKGGQLFRERRIQRSERLLGGARIADTSLGYAVAVESSQPDNADVGAVQLTVVQCND